MLSSSASEKFDVTRHWVISLKDRYRENDSFFASLLEAPYIQGLQNKNLELELGAEKVSCK